MKRTLCVHSLIALSTAMLLTLGACIPLDKGNQHAETSATPSVQPNPSHQIPVPNTEETISEPPQTNRPIEWALDDIDLFYDEYSGDSLVFVDRLGRFSLTFPEHWRGRFLIHSSAQGTTVVLKDAYDALVIKEDMLCTLFQIGAWVHDGPLERAYGEWRGEKVGADKLYGYWLINPFGGLPDVVPNVYEVVENHDDYRDMTDNLRETVLDMFYLGDITKK